MSTEHAAPEGNQRQSTQSRQGVGPGRMAPADGAGMEGYLLHLQRTAGNQAVNALLRRYSEQQAGRAGPVPLQRDGPDGGTGSAPTPDPASAGSGSGNAPTEANLELPPPAPQQASPDQLSSATPPSDQPGGSTGGQDGTGGQGGTDDPDNGEVDLVRTTTNARTGAHTIDFTANAHVPFFHLPSFSVLGREVQPFDDQSVFLQLSFDPTDGGLVPGTSVSYSRLHSTMMGVSASALNAHIFSLHGREFFDVALPLSLGAQNDATGNSLNAQAGVEASVNVTRALSVTATVNGQANIPLGGGPVTFTFAGVSIGVAGKF